MPWDCLEDQTCKGSHLYTDHFLLSLKTIETVIPKVGVLFRPAVLSKFQCPIADYHTLLKVKIGLPITHDRVSNEIITWKNTKFSLQDEPWILLSKEIDVYGRSALKNVK